MKSYILIKTKNLNINEIVLKLNQINVNVYLSYINNNYLYLKIDHLDYKKVLKYYKYLNFKIERYYGKKYFITILKKYYLIFLSIILIFSFLYFSSFIIVDIKIDHENEKIVKLLNEELESFGIKKFTIRKNFKTLNEIKNKIEKQNKDNIDWLEIEVKGMKYIIKVEERLINKKEIKNNYCNVYAKKSGLIQNIDTYKGQNVVKINNYVKEGDLLISGDITLNDEIKNQVCAEGEVYAQVWYNVKVSIPFTYYEKEKTNKKRNNIVININDKDYVILANRLENFESKKKLIFEGLGIKIFLRKDYEVKKIKHTYTQEEILKRAVELAKEKINLRLLEKEEIIYEKVLQKSINNSTMEMDVFIIANQQIGYQKVEGDLN